MKFLSKILKAPIRNTVIILFISIIGYILFSLLSLYLARVMCSENYIATGSCRGTSLQMFISMILGDFKLMFRIATELSVILLISQAIYRLATRSK